MAGLAGGTATVTLHFSTAAIPTTYFNYGPTADNPEPHWYEFLFDGTTGAEILADRIILHFVDGQRGDHDLATNGTVLTEGGPATILPEIPDPDLVRLADNSVLISWDKVRDDLYL